MVAVPTQRLPEDALAALARDGDRLLAAIHAERARRSNSRTFSAFVKQAWQYVPSCDPLVWGWHVDAICSHLEEVAYGRIRKLVINIPPGHAKSVLQSVLWPAWVWTWWPQCQFLMASHAQALATRDSVRCRAVIESDWYVETFMRPGKWGLRIDQNAKDYFVNTVGGERFSTGVGGIGRRAHIIGIDDPIEREDVYSAAERQRVNDWLGQTISTRFVDARVPRLSLVMQRLHAEDPSAFLLAGGDVEHLMLPAELDVRRRCVTYHFVEKRNGHTEIVKQEFWRDPRTAEGELLFPERFTREVLQSFKLPNQLGAHGYATQFGQHPAPPEGGMFKIKAWRFWTSTPAALSALGYETDPQRCVRPRGCATVDEAPARMLDLDALEEQLVSVDPSFRETESGSKVAIHVWGRLGARRILVYRVSRRMDFSETVSELLRVIRTFPKARRRLIEGKANGDAIISHLTRVHGVTGLEPVSPGTANKEARAQISQSYQAAGNIELPEGAPWVDEYVAEHTAFPNGPTDDDVDAESQALSGMEREESAADAWAKLYSGRRAASRCIACAGEVRNGRCSRCGAPALA